VSEGVHMRKLMYILHSDRHYIWTARPVARNTEPVQHANMKSTFGKLDVYGNCTKKKKGVLREDTPWKMASTNDTAQRS